MERLLKYCLSLILVALMFSCENVSNETYHKLTESERKILSSEYTQLALRLEKGSPKHMRLLEKAIRINPENDIAWKELSVPYLYRGMFKEWSHHINEAVRLNPQAWQSRRAYDKLFYLRDYTGAIYDLDATDTLTNNVVDYVSNTSVDFLRGLSYRGLNDYENSKKYFNKYIEHETKEVGEEFIDESAFLYLGIIANDEGNFDLSLEYLERAEKYETSVAEVDYYKCVALLNKGEFERAKRALAKAREKFEDDKRLRSYYYEPLGRIYISDIEKLEMKLREAT